MIKQNTLLIDIDGVLRNIEPEILSIYNRQYNPSNVWKTEEDITHWNAVKEWDGMPPMGKFLDFHAKEIFDRAKPYKNAVATMHELYLNNYIHIVSAQRTTTRDMTTVWLDKYKIPYDRLTYTKDKHKVSGDYLIDDGIHNLESCIDGCKPICVNQPWNQDWLGDRISNLEELPAYLEKQR